MELAQKNPGSPDYKIKSIEIESYALKRQLARELMDLYRDQNLIYTEYKKGSSTFNVKIQNNQWRDQSKANKGQYKQYIESKFEPTTENKYDKIISGKIKATVVYEDDEVMAIDALKPEAKVHCVIFHKQKRGLTSMLKLKECHEKQMGHLMRVVAKVAKIKGLEGGYRTVINNGKHANQNEEHLKVHVLGGQQLLWPPGTQPL